MAINPELANQGVLVADWSKARLERIMDVLCPSCRVDPVFRCDRILPALHRLAPSVVVFPLRWHHAAGACPSEMCLGERVLDAVSRLPHPPLTVTFAESAHNLPLSEYCSPFVKGATALLDESDPGFYQELRAKVVSGLKRARESDSTAYCSPELRSLVGSSPAIQGIRDQVLKAAKLGDVPVLITGESGTGKEVVAMAIHRLDKTRAKGPFIAVNCSAVSSSLAESEFFGHKRGAFTDASADRQGYFRAAHGGVLFLDEISELDQSLQPKLLRVLQEGSVCPVGEEHEQKIDIRIIAASNKDLPAEVARGSFRMDLYQRLDVLSVCLPPLRMRKEDIEPLVRCFLKKHASCYAGTITEIDSRVLELLTTLDYEGNVRELENLVRKILFHKEIGETITMADLPSEIVAHTCRGNGSGSLDTFADALHEKVKQGLSCTEALAECERLLLTRAMQESNGSRSKMAAILKLSPRTLFNRLRACGLLAPTQQLEQQ